MQLFILPNKYESFEDFRRKKGGEKGMKEDTEIWRRKKKDQEEEEEQEEEREKERRNMTLRIDNCLDIYGWMTFDPMERGEWLDELTSHHDHWSYRFARVAAASSLFHVLNGCPEGEQVGPFPCTSNIDSDCGDDDERAKGGRGAGEEEEEIE